MSCRRIDTERLGWAFIYTFGGIVALGLVGIVAFGVAALIVGYFPWSVIGLAAFGALWGGMYLALREER